MQRVRILVADDEPAIQGLYSAVLSRQAQVGASDVKQQGLPNAGRPTFPDVEVEFDLTFVSAAAEAVAAIRQSLEDSARFAVAFIDVRMLPGPDGIWAAEQIRKLDPLVQIVMATSFCDVHPRDIAENTPPAHRLLYVQKPLHPLEIQQFAVSLSAKWRAEVDLDFISGDGMSLLEAPLRRLRASLQECLTNPGHCDEAIPRALGELDGIQRAIRGASDRREQGD